jgi:hypothetical protein
MASELGLVLKCTLAQLCYPQLLDNSSRLEQEVAARDEEILRLRGAAESLGAAVHQERRQGLQLAAENDRLRILDIETQHRLAVLTRLCGKSEAEVARAVDASRQPEEAGRGERIARFQGRAAERGRRSPGTLGMEVEHLEQQLVEQERLHGEQVQEERRARRAAEQAGQAERTVLRGKVAALQETVAGLEAHLAASASELAAARSGHRKAENGWSNERAVLVRKLQFIEKFGTLEGSHSSHRAQERVAGQGRLQARAEKLEAEAAGRERELEKLRGRLLAAGEEAEGARARAEAAASVLARKTKAMAEQVTVLTERSEKAEVRRAREAEGHQAAVGLLRGRMVQLEEKLLAMAAACGQERRQEALVEELRQELRVAAQRRPRQWKD